MTDTRLLFAVDTGKVFQLSTEGSVAKSCMELRGHVKDVYAILSLGGRILPRHWLPSIIGRSNVIQYYRYVGRAHDNCLLLQDVFLVSFSILSSQFLPLSNLKTTVSRQSGF